MKNVFTRRRTIATLAAAIAGLAAIPARASDPTTADCLAASEASLQSSNEHRLRAERSQLLVCAAPSCPADVRKECLRRVDEVNTEIPTVIFQVKDATGNDLGGVSVRMDGELLSERLQGTALSLDPGEHSFVFEAPGIPALTRKLLIVQGEKDRREILVLAGPTEGTATRSGTSQPSKPAAPAAAPLGAQRVLALVATGVGVAGLAVGGAFGITAMTRKNDAESACPTARCDPAGLAKWNDAKSAGNLSTAFFIVGGVGLAAGAALWFTAKPAEPTSPTAALVLGPADIELRGTW
jgi:hypothetical protein